jgi:hypothetical protein
MAQFSSKWIANSAIIEAKIATGAVTEGKIGSGAVTEAKIGTGAVTYSKIGALAVLEAAIDTGAVTVNKIGSGAVTEIKLGTGAVTEGKLGSAAVTSDKLAASAKQSVLQSKLIGRRTGVLTFTANGGSDVVTTEVEAAATVDTPQTSLETAKGIYVGAVSGANDAKKVLIRAAGTDNGVDDGAGDDVYGVLTEATGVFTLTYKKADGTGYSFATDTDIDFYFAEIFDLYTQPAEKGLMPVGGVVDSTQASAINNHINDITDAHDASAISFDPTGLENTDATDEQGLGEDLDAAIGALDATPTNYTPGDAAVVADHLAAIDTALGGLVMTPASEELTLNGTDITNKYKDLTDIPLLPAAVIVVPVGGPVQNYGADFTIITNGSVIKRLNWNGLGMDGILESGDKIRVIFDK